jgi:hypothetical protein
MPQRPPRQRLSSNALVDTELSPSVDRPQTGLGEVRDSGRIVGSAEVIAEPSFLESEPSPAVLQRLARGPETGCAKTGTPFRPRSLKIASVG